MLEKSKVKELAQFLNLDEKTILEMDKAIQDLPGFAKWINIATHDWFDKKVDQNKRADVEKWFRNNDKYIFELCDVHSRKPKKRISRQVIKICKKYRVKTILDYGGGIGEDSIYAVKAGLRASMADLSSLTFDFAKWRAKYYSLPIKFIEIKNNTPLQETYDAITCFEVIQHLFEPEKVVRHLIEHLNLKGLFFVTTRFNNPTYPMALSKNYKYEEGMVDFLQKNGLKLIHKIYQYGEGDRVKFLYVYQKQ